MRRVRGDLSAPVLAVIVTLMTIAAGIAVVFSWLYWYAPEKLATRTVDAVEVVGTAVLDKDSRLYIVLRNRGYGAVKLLGVHVEGAACELAFGSQELAPGSTEAYLLVCPSSAPVGRVAYGVVVTDCGVLPFTAIVQR